jgi:hypothetical protein
MPEEAYLAFKLIIDEICVALQAGDEVRKETRINDLCWAWINARTEEEWIISASGIITIKIHDKTNDPRIQIIGRFAHGSMTAQEAKIQLEQLEKLRAFW